MQCRVFHHEVLIEQDPTYHEGPVHVSELVRRVAVTVGDLDDKEFDPDEDHPMIASGLAWEEYWQRWMAKQVQHFQPHPGRFEVDRVVGRPDGMSVDDDGIVWVDECKFTKKSANQETNDPLRSKKWGMWRRQIMAYIKLTGADQARLWALHINGTYEKAKFGQPLFLEYRFEFSEREIEDNWLVLLAHKREGE